MDELGVRNGDQRIRGRVLLVEDQPVDAQRCKLTLKSIGYRADWARNSQEALQLLDIEEYDAILLDVQMSDVAGLDTTRQIREKFGATTCPRIVAVGAGTSGDEREACLAAGMDDCIPKPVSRALLDSALGNLDQPQIRTALVEELRRQIGDQGLRQFIGTLIDSIPPMVEDVRRAFGEHSTTELHRAADSLKAATQTVGCDEIVRCVRELETIGRAEPTVDGEPLLAKLDDLLRELEVELRQLHDDLTPS